MPIHEWGKNVATFGEDDSSSRHIDNKKKRIVVLGEGSTGELDDIIMTVETKYSVDITNSRKKICLSLQYNAANSFLYVYGVQIY